MVEESKKRWLLKDEGGRVRGPFHTDEILRKISVGEISGDEMISLYPGADWIPIANDAQFYDQLLSHLEGERGRVDNEVHIEVDLPKAEDNIGDEFVEGKHSFTPAQSTGRGSGTETEKVQNKAERVGSHKVKEEKIEKKTATI